MTLRQPNQIREAERGDGLTRDTQRCYDSCSSAEYDSTVSKKSLRVRRGTTATPCTKPPADSEKLRITEIMGFGSSRLFLRRRLRLSWAKAKPSSAEGEGALFQCLQSKLRMDRGPVATRSIWARGRDRWTFSLTA